MENFPGNSHNIPGDQTSPKAPKPEKDVQKVVTGVVIERKKPLGRRFKEIFFKGDLKNAAAYVVNDVLLPALKNMFVDTVSEGAKRAVYGESITRRRMELGRPKTTYNYPVDRDRFGRSRASLPDQPPYASPRRRQDVGETIFYSRADAELVLERLLDIIDKFDVASVADLHELCNLPSTFIDNKWGWQALGSADIRQIREGYLLDLPSPEPI